MFKLFIKRPILSGVISVIIVCLGVLSILTLPITQFPDIVPPSVTVTARYTGASADVMSKTVATPLERAINGVPGMTYMTTVCTNDGMSLTTIYFKVGTDPDVAAVNVQNRVTTVLDELPEEVIRAGVITEKEVNSMLMYLNIMSTDSAHTEKFVYNFADINILRELKRIDGVGLVEIMGSRDYAMRVWLNPNRLAAYNMVPQDVTEAIRNQNIEAAPGKTGISSDKLPQQLQYVLQYTGKFSTAEEYGEIVLKALPDGSLLRLKDVATIEFDSEDYNMTSMTDGRPSASIMIKQRPGSNAREVIQNIKTKMAEIKESSFAPGMDYNISYDVSRFLDASIQSVLKTLLEAFILVFIVVYIFLQDFRSTLIPAIAVPVSLVGTFFFMEMLGFSINMLTLFALVLAIGIVVDNAIVVVEAVHVKMHHEKLSPYKASVAAINEIGGAIIAITLVMSAVFVQEVHQGHLDDPLEDIVGIGLHQGDDMGGYQDGEPFLGGGGADAGGICQFLIDHRLGSMGRHDGHEIEKCHLIGHLGEVPDVPLQVGVHIGAVIGLPVHGGVSVERRHGASEDPRIDLIETALPDSTQPGHQPLRVCGVGDALIATQLRVGETQQADDPHTAR